MSAVIAQFQMNNFTSALEDVNKHHSQMPLRKVFEHVEILMRKKMSPSIPDALVDSLYKLEEVFTECRLVYEKKKRRRLPRYTVKEAYKLYKINRDLSEIEKTLQTVNEASASSSTEDQEHISEVPEIPRVYGFDTVKEEIITSLMRQDGGSDSINTAGIVGMGGSGKTTLAQLVCNDERVKKTFIPRIWVPVSSNPDTKSESTKGIAEYLLKELGDQDDDDDDDEEEERRDPEQVREEADNIILDKLLVRLHKQLYGKKYLIVFDDVWHIDSWYSKLVNSNGEAHIGLPREYGAGIIVTSRLRQDVLKMVGKANLHHPPSLLDDDHCWSIFTDVLHEEKVDMDNPSLHQLLSEMRSEIVQNCYGLPLAAKTLGGIISKKLQEEERKRLELQGIFIPSIGVWGIKDSDLLDHFFNP